LEDLSSEGPQAISDFINLEDNISLKTTNVRNSSVEAGVYDKVKNGLVLDSKLCQDIYSGKIAKHFYSKTYIDQFISQWTGKNKHDDQ